MMSSRWLGIRSSCFADANWARSFKPRCGGYSYDSCKNQLESFASHCSTRIMSFDCRRSCARDERAVQDRLMSPSIGLAAEPIRSCGVAATAFRPRQKMAGTADHGPVTRAPWWARRLESHCTSASGPPNKRRKKCRYDPDFRNSGLARSFGVPDDPAGLR